MTPARHSPTDAAALMARYCDGDAQAFHALYAQLAPRLLTWLQARVPDRAAAESLLSQTFVELHRTRPNYVRGAAPEPWLQEIAAWVCRQAARRARARARASWLQHPWHLSP